FSRVERTEKVEHLVALNNAATPAVVDVASLSPDRTFTHLYGGHADVTAGSDGTVSLTVPPLSAVVLVADGEVAAADGAPTIELTAPTPGAAVSGTAPVAADVDDALWQETSFAYRVLGEDGWTPLGTAE